MQIIRHFFLFSHLNFINLSLVVIEEIEDDDKQHRNLRRLKKKHEISDSEDVETGSKQLAVRNKESMKDESEDDDGFPICFNVGDKASKKKKISGDQKRKVDETSQNMVSIRSVLFVDSISVCFV